MKNGLFFFIVIYLGLFLVGCAMPNQPMADDPYFAPVYPEPPASQLEITGSMFQANQASLFSDIRAHKVGDIITVVLSESTQASKSANNSIKKNSSIKLDPVIALGSNATMSGSPIDLTYKDGMSTSRVAGADQGNSLQGSISANVMQVLDNGNLVIRGEKWMTINNGNEFIRLTGIVRSADINPDNTVNSTRIANARIEYSGTGSFANSQKVGWLSRFFYSSWWPF